MHATALPIPRLPLTRVLRLICTTVAMLLLWLPPHAAHAAGPQLITFYSSSKAAYDSWDGTTNGAPPLQVVSFPAGTSQIAYYFEFSGATPERTHFQATIRDHTGAVFVKGLDHVVHHASGAFMTYFTYQPAFPAGSYRMDLVLGGSSFFSTTFSVAAGRGIGAFYTATTRAFTAWSTAPEIQPQHVDRFPAGTAAIAYFIAYAGMKAGVTTFHIIVHRQIGELTDVWTLTGINHTFAKAHGSFMATFFYHPAFAVGNYTADLLVDGVLLISTTFTVAAS